VEHAIAAELQGTEIAVAAQQKYVNEEVYRFYRMRLFRANFRTGAWSCVF
jgi:hypothetical protein